MISGKSVQILALAARLWTVGSPSFRRALALIVRTARNAREVPPGNALGIKFETHGGGGAPGKQVDGKC